eukprot:CAMPEP_0168501912 /NCGR_PEP_ID=MMETSP0228-20121227/75045_1 /TAXON_ID=133427 /ORGANISM="Protoceratium reticulatum, Strain CCCM 535 (=CCMP 1889)" /LENGTH=56 /DNA_ID=CAMNT_0008518873 /DNA_START=26 /DNA_END=196 /DNA_ORIENTATION=+
MKASTWSIKNCAILVGHMVARMGTNHSHRPRPPARYSAQHSSSVMATAGFSPVSSA